MLALLVLALAAHCRALGDVSELAVLQGDGVWTDDRYGTCLCNIGDVNGDGIDDLMVGADGDDDGGTDYGAVYVARLLPPTSLTPSQVRLCGRGNPNPPGENQCHDRRSRRSRE